MAHSNGQDSVVAVGSDQSSIVLYSTTSGKLVASLEGHTSRVKGLAMSPDNQLLLSASSDGTIRAWTLPESLVCCMQLVWSDKGVALLREVGVLIPSYIAGWSMSLASMT